MKNFIPELKKIYPYLCGIVIDIAKEADRTGFNAYLVGGFVRDIILGVANFDVDIVIDGRDSRSGNDLAGGISFARALSAKFKAGIKEYPPFGTATITIDVDGKKKNNVKIDIVTARKEKYPEPGALPKVEFSVLRDDLYRRDFTINAMAIAISGKSSGELVDYFGGISDIGKKLIRVLHDKSFIDDPTRIYRAIRFESIFGFEIEKDTEHLIRQAVKYGAIKTIERYRIKKEMTLLLASKSAGKSLARMKELNIPG